MTFGKNTLTLATLSPFSEPNLNPRSTEFLIMDSSDELDDGLYEAVNGDCSHMDVLPDDFGGCNTHLCAFGAEGMDADMDYNRYFVCNRCQDIYLCTECVAQCGHSIHLRKQDDYG